MLVVILKLLIPMSDWILKNLEAIFAGLAFLFSAVVFARTEKFNRKILRETIRTNYTTALFEIDKKLIECPELWAIYDQNVSGIQKVDTPSEKGKSIALLYLHFNLFESVYTTYNNVLRKLNKADREFWETWRNYIQEFIEGSSEARELFYNPSFQLVYRESYKNFIKSIIEEFEEKQRLATNA